jgi:hypothetical protein
MAVGKPQKNSLSVRHMCDHPPPVIMLQGEQHPIRIYAGRRGEGEPRSYAAELALTVEDRPLGPITLSDQVDTKLDHAWIEQELEGCV